MPRNPKQDENLKKGRDTQFKSGEKAARKQDKAAGSCAPRSDHICPRCGQFWTFARAFQKQRKTDGGRCRMRKARCFKKNSGVPTKFAR